MERNIVETNFCSLKGRNILPGTTGLAKIKGCILSMMLCCSCLYALEDAGSESVLYKPCIDDRPAWDTLAKTKEGKEIIEAAARDLSAPLPKTSDELYLEFSRNGIRRNWEKINFSRRGRIGLFAFAECLENKGRFIKGIEEAICDVCAERTWVMPAHDKELDNFNGKRNDVDLGSSALAASMAAVCAVMGDRLNPAVRNLIREKVNERILDPFKDMISGKIKPNAWINSTYNWNAVCLCNVTVAGLQFAKTASERDFYIETSCKFTGNYVSGFTADGACVEGMGYWNYGFGHFTILSELIRRASNGSRDPLLWPEVRKPALFGIEAEIANGVYPTFADCSQNPKADPKLLGFLSRRLGWGLANYEAVSRKPSKSFVRNMLYCFPWNEKISSETHGSLPLGFRTCFPDWGVFIFRSVKGLNSNLGIAVKGGSNSGPHSHNDVGSYIIAKGGIQLLCDPGAEVYTKKTFSKDRYQSRILSSLGHSVPVIDGLPQKTGPESKGIVLSTNFTPECDEIRFDMKTAYGNPKLLKLERSFKFHRSEPCYIEIRDDFEFSSPVSFEDAIMIFGNLEILPDGKLKISYDGHSALISTDSNNSPIEIASERFTEDIRGKDKPLRIALKFKSPLTKGRLIMRVSSLE